MTNLCSEAGMYDLFKQKQSIYTKLASNSKFNNFILCLYESSRTDKIAGYGIHLLNIR